MMNSYFNVGLLLFVASGANTFVALLEYPESIGAFNAGVAVFAFGIGILMSANVVRD